jgi:hypothetical protein
MIYRKATAEKPSPQWRRRMMHPNLRSTNGLHIEVVMSGNVESKSAATFVDEVNRANWRSRPASQAREIRVNHTARLLSALAPVGLKAGNPAPCASPVLPQFYSGQKIKMGGQKNNLKSIL